MDGSPSAIITLGFGTGTFAGTPNLVITTGYGIGEIAATVYLTVTTHDSLTHTVTSSIRGDEVD